MRIHRLSIVWVFSVFLTEACAPVESFDGELPVTVRAAQADTAWDPTLQPNALLVVVPNPDGLDAIDALRQAYPDYEPVRLSELASVVAPPAAVTLSGEVAGHREEVGPAVLVYLGYVGLEQALVAVLGLSIGAAIGIAAYAEVDERQLAISVDAPDDLRRALAAGPFTETVPGGEALVTAARDATFDDPLDDALDDEDAFADTDQFDPEDCHTSGTAVRGRVPAVVSSAAGTSYFTTLEPVVVCASPSSGTVVASPRRIVFPPRGTSPLDTRLRVVNRGKLPVHADIADIEPYNGVAALSAVDGSNGPDIVIPPGLSVEMVLEHARHFAALEVGFSATFQHRRHGMGEVLLVRSR